MQSGENIVRYIDLEQLTYQDKLWLRKLFLEKPDDYFFAGENQIEGVTLVLSHPLLRRERHLTDVFDKNVTYKQIKYDVLGKQPIGEGAFGKVSQCKKTLTLTSHSLLDTVDNKHVVKMTAENYKNPKKGETSLGIFTSPKKSTFLERKKQKKGSRFRPKKTIRQLNFENHDVSALFTTSHFFEGSTLLDWLISENDFNLLQQIELSIALLRALQEQVHDLEMVHRDIKPANILVNFKTLEVNILDLGSAKSINDKIGTRNGTPYYMPPEAFSENQNLTLIPNYDILSMGLVLSEIFGNSRILYPHLIDNRNNVNGLMASENISTTDKSIKQIIADMTQTNPEKRPNIDNLIKRFEAAYISNKYPKFANPADLQNAFNVGADLRKEMLKCNSNQVEMENFITSVKEKLKKLSDDGAVIAEFIHGLGWQRVLPAVNNKQDLINNIESNFKKYRDNVKKYKVLLETAKTYYENVENEVDQKNPQDLRIYMAELQAKLTRLENNPLDLVQLTKLTHNLQTKYEARVIRFWHMQMQLRLEFREAEKIASSNNYCKNMQPYEETIRRYLKLQKDVEEKLKEMSKENKNNKFPDMGTFNKLLEFKRQLAYEITVMMNNVPHNLIELRKTAEQSKQNFADYEKRFAAIQNLSWFERHPVASGALLGVTFALVAGFAIGITAGAAAPVVAGIAIATGGSIAAAIGIGAGAATLFAGIGSAITSWITKKLAIVPSLDEVEPKLLQPLLKLSKESLQEKVICQPLTSTAKSLKQQEPKRKKDHILQRTHRKRKVPKEMQKKKMNNTEIVKDLSHGPEKVKVSGLFLISTHSPSGKETEHSARKTQSM